MQNLAKDRKQSIKEKTESNGNQAESFSHRPGTELLSEPTAH